MRNLPDMRYLAIDYGFKRLGLAHCDAGEMIVSPLCQLPYDLTVLEKLRQIITDNEIEAVVVGLPLNMDGSEGDQAKVSRKFARKLEKTISLPVYLQDERLSSAAADEMLSESGLTNKKRKARRDMLAACDILRNFLETEKNE